MKQPMPFRGRNILRSIALLLILLALPAHASEVKWQQEFVFTSLPSELNPEWQKGGKRGKGVSEIVDGKLLIDSNGDRGISWKIGGESAQTLWDASTSSTIEFRVRIKQLGAGAEGGAQMILADGQKTVSLPLANTEWQTYRILLSEGDATVYTLDSGKPPQVLRGKALKTDAPPENSLSFGDLSLAVDGISEWEFIRWTNAETVEP